MDGSCLCGGVRFVVEGDVGPFELCHCKRCQKMSGSAFVSALVAETENVRFTSGTELIQKYEAPLLSEPPLFTVYFCAICGSNLPDPRPIGKTMDIPAGLLNYDPGICPDKHIYVDLKACWERIVDDLPQYTKAQFKKLRSGG